MQITARHRDKITIFDVSGNIDFANSSQLRQSVLREIIERRTPCVVVNLGQVSYIGDSGVASLVEGLKASRDLGSRFILFGLSVVLQCNQRSNGADARVDGVPVAPVLHDPVGMFFGPFFVVISILGIGGQHKYAK